MYICDITRLCTSALLMWMPPDPPNINDPILHKAPHTRSHIFYTYMYDIIFICMSWCLYICHHIYHIWHTLWHLIDQHTHRKRDLCMRQRALNIGKRDLCMTSYLSYMTYLVNIHELFRCGCPHRNSPTWMRHRITQHTHRKRDLCMHQRALYIRKRDLCMRQRALYIRKSPIDTLFLNAHINGPTWMRHLIIISSSWRIFIFVTYEYRYVWYTNGLVWMRHRMIMWRGSSSWRISVCVT